MKKKIGFGLLVVLSSVQMLFSQSGKDSSKVQGLKSFLKVELGGISGLEWEQKISKKSALLAGAGTAVGFQSDDWTDFKSPIIFVPVAYVDYRNYYNLLRRISTQKNTVNNSADFVFGGVRSIFGVKKQNHFGFFLIQGWGARRSLGKKINVDCRVGIAEHFYYDKTIDGGFNYLKLEPDFQWSFSYAL